MISKQQQVEALVESSGGQVFRVNLAWTRMQPWQEEQVVLPEKFFCPDDLPALRAGAGDAARRKSGFELECRACLIGDSHSWIRLHAIPYCDDGGNFTEWLVTATTIDLAKRLEAALDSSEKLASLGRLTAAIAHEINNPLEAVSNLLFIALLDAQLSAKTREMLQQADAELQRAAKIARQSLSYYREREGATPVSLVEVMESALSLLKIKIALKRATVETQYRNVVPTAAIPGELRQVFGNLLLNSLDAMDPGGKIVVRISHKIGTYSRARRVQIVVADNGKGISPLMRSHIFDPFFTTKGVGGTGLGLWITERIVRKHGGTIRVKSSIVPGRSGTCFVVTVPQER